MAWVSQGSFSIPSVVDGWQVIPSYGTTEYFYITRDSSGRAVSRFTITGTTPTHDSANSFNAASNSQQSVAGSTMGMVRTNRVFFTTITSTGRGSITGIPTSNSPTVATGVNETTCITGNRLYYLDSLTAPTRISAYSYALGDSTLPRQSSEDITFTGHSYGKSRLITDGTTIWLMGISSDGLTVTGTAWTISTRARDTDKDFSATFTTAQYDVNFDGSNIYVMTSTPSTANAVTKYSFTDTVLATGYTPSFGTALDGTGTALPTENDGTTSAKPITSRTTFNVPITWPSGSGRDVLAGFTSADVSVSDDSSVVSAVVTSVTRVGTTDVWRALITVTESSTGITSANRAVTFTVSVRAGALPQSSARNASVAASGTFYYQATISPLAAGYTPSVGTALDNAGNALSTSNDGTTSAKPITSRTSFIVPITWPSGSATDVVAGFVVGDMTVSSNSPTVAGAVVTSVTRVGSTNVWRALITVSEAGSGITASNRAVTFTIGVSAGALPQSATRRASAAASGTFYYQATISQVILASGYTPSLGTALDGTGNSFPSSNDGSSSSNPITSRTTFNVPITWPSGAAADVLAGFAVGDMTVTSTDTAVATAVVTSITRQGTTNVWRALITVTEAVSGIIATNRLISFTIGINAAALPASSTRAASISASQAYHYQAALSALSAGWTPSLGDAQDLNGNALASENDGTTTAKPILSRTSFNVPVTWPAGSATDVTAQLRANDFAVTSTASSVATAEVTAVTRVGSTNVWRALVTITEAASGIRAQNQNVSFTVALASGAIPRTQLREASIGATKRYYYRAQLSSVTVTSGSWTSKGIVTFPTYAQGFPTQIGGSEWGNVISGSGDDNKVFLFDFGNRAVYAYTVGAFSQAAATATRDTAVPNLQTGSNATPRTPAIVTVTATQYIVSGYATGNIYEHWTFSRATGIGSGRTNLRPSPLPLGRHGFQSGLTVYVLDSVSGTQTLLAYTLRSTGAFDEADTSKNITLAAGAAADGFIRASLAIFADDEFFWVAGTPTGESRRRLRGYAYKISDGTRQSGRDFDYTDTADVEYVTMVNGEIYLFRDGGSVATFDNTARVLRFRPPAAPTWISIDDQNVRAANLFTLDLSNFSTGSPEPRFSFTSGYTPPSWLSISGNVISGTPPSPYTGANTLTIQVSATNGGGTTNQTFTLNVHEPVLYDLQRFYTTTALTFRTYPHHLPFLQFTDGTTLWFATRGPDNASRTVAANNNIIFRAMTATGTRDASKDFTLSFTSMQTIVDVAYIQKSATEHRMLTLTVGTGIESRILNVRAYTLGGANDSSLNWTATLPSNADPRGIVAVGQRVYVVELTTNMLMAFSRTGTRQADNDISLANVNATVSSIAHDGTNILVLDGVDRRVYTYQEALGYWAQSSWNLSSSQVSFQDILPVTAGLLIPSVEEDDSSVVQAQRKQVPKQLFQYAREFLNSWSAIPSQSVRVTESFTLDVAPFIAGNPPPTITFTSGYTQPAWLSLTGTVLSGTPPGADYTSDATEGVQLTATNLAGSVSTTFSLAIGSGTAPTLGTVAVDDLKATVDSVWSVDIADEISGFPVPTVGFKSGYTKPAWLSLSGTVLSGTPPSTTYTQGGNVTETIELTLTNTKAATDVELDLVINTGAVPSWGAIAAQTVVPELEGSLDVSPALTAFPAATVAFKSGYTAPSWLTLSGTTLTWDLDEGTYAADRTETVQLTATNTVGSTDVNVTLNIDVASAPVWTTAAISLTAYTNVAFSHTFGTDQLSDYYPQPTLTIASPPSWLTVSGLTISGTPTAAAVLTLSVRASNAGGAVSKTITLTVIAGVVPVAAQTNVRQQLVRRGMLEFRNLATTFGITANPAAQLGFTPGFTRPSFVTVVGVDGLDIDLPVNFFANLVLQLRFTNPLGHVDIVVTYSADQPPVWTTTIPNLDVALGGQEVVEFDLERFLSGEPRPTVALRTGATNPSGASITSRLVGNETHYFLRAQGIVGTENQVVFVSLTATNRRASAHTTIGLRLVEPPIPWDITDTLIRHELGLLTIGGTINIDLSPAVADWPDQTVAMFGVKEFDAEWTARRPTTDIGIDANFRLRGTVPRLSGNPILEVFFLLQGTPRHYTRNYEGPLYGANPVVPLSLDGYLVSFTFQPVAEVAPAIEATGLEVRPGAALRFDMYTLPDIGAPVPLITFQPRYVPPSWLSIESERYLVGVPPPSQFRGGITELNVLLRARNAAGTSNFVVTVTVAAPTGPRFREMPDRVTMVPETANEEIWDYNRGVYDISDYMISGHPRASFRWRVVGHGLWPYGENYGDYQPSTGSYRSFNEVRQRKRLDLQNFALFAYYYYSVFREYTPAIDWVKLDAGEMAVNIDLERFQPLTHVCPENGVLFEFVLINEEGLDTEQIVLAYAGGSRSPSWLSIPEQFVLVGEPMELNIVQFAQGQPTPRIVFRPGFIPPTWMTFTRNNRFVLGTPPPTLYTTNQRVDLLLVAESPGGTANVQFPIRVLQGDPHWLEIDDIHIVNGGESFNLDLKEFILAKPAATLSFKPGFTAPSWLNLSSDGILSGQATGYTRQTTEQIQIRATNSLGNEDTTFNIVITTAYIFTKSRLIPQRPLNLNYTQFVGGGLVYNPDLVDTGQTTQESPGNAGDLATNALLVHSRSRDEEYRTLGPSLTAMGASSTRLYVLGRRFTGDRNQLLTYDLNGRELPGEHLTPVSGGNAIVRTRDRFYILHRGRILRGGRVPGTSRNYTWNERVEPSRVTAINAQTGLVIDSESWSFPTVEQQPQEVLPSGGREEVWTLAEVSTWFMDMAFFNGKLYFAAGTRDLARDLWAFNVDGTRDPSSDIELTSLIDRVDYMAVTNTHVFVYAEEDDIAYAFTHGGVYEPEFDVNMRNFMRTVREYPFGTAFYAGGEVTSRAGRDLRVLEMVSDGTSLIFLMNNSMLFFFSNQNTPPAWSGHPALVNSFLHSRDQYGVVKPGYTELSLFMDGNPRPTARIAPGAPPWFSILFGRYLYSQLPTGLYNVDAPTLVTVPVILSNLDAAGATREVTTAISFFVYPPAYKVDFDMRDTQLGTWTLHDVRDGIRVLWDDAPDVDVRTLVGFTLRTTSIWLLLTPYILNLKHVGPGGYPSFEFIGLRGADRRRPGVVTARVGNDYILGLLPRGPLARIAESAYLNQWSRFHISLGIIPPRAAAAVYSRILPEDVTPVAPFWRPIATQTAEVGELFFLDLGAFGSTGIPSSFRPFLVPGTELPPWLSLQGWALHGTPGDDFLDTDYPVEHRISLRLTNQPPRVGAVGSPDVTITINVVKSSGFPRFNRQLPRRAVVIGENFQFDLASYVDVYPLVSFQLVRAGSTIGVISGSILGGQVTVPMTNLRSPSPVDLFPTNNRFDTVLTQIDATNIYGTTRGEFLMDVVGPENANPPRWWHTLPQILAYQGETINYYIGEYVGGAPSPTLRFTLGQPRLAWLTLADGWLQGTVPDDATAGVHNAYVTAHGGTTGQQTAVSAWQILVREVDAANGAGWKNIPQQTVTVGRDYRVDVAPYLNGTPTPSVSLPPGTKLPDWLSLDGTVLSGRYDYNGLRSTPSFKVNLRADNARGMADVEFGIRLQAVDYPPIWSLIPDMRFSVGQNVAISPLDYVRGEPVPVARLLPFDSRRSLGTPTLPSWLVWDATRQLLSGAVTETDFPVRYDNQRRFDSEGNPLPGQEFRYPVQFDASNRAVAIDAVPPRSSRFQVIIQTVLTIDPYFTPIGPQYVEAGHQFTLDLRPFLFGRPDPTENWELNTLTREAVLPEGMTITTEGVLTWTPSATFYLSERVERIRVRGYKVVSAADAEQLAGGTDSFDWGATTNIEFLVRPAGAMYPPAWGVFGTQEVNVDEQFELDLQDFLVGNPAPIVSIPSDAENLLPFWLILDTTSDPGHPTLRGIPPSAYYTRPASVLVDLAATNSQGTTRATLSIAVRQVVTLDDGSVITATPPTWDNIPVIDVEVGSQLNFNFADFAAGDDLQLGFADGYEPPSWLQIVGTRLIGTPPYHLFRENQLFFVTLGARNAYGYARVQVVLQLLVVQYPFLKRVDLTDVTGIPNNGAMWATNTRIYLAAGDRFQAFTNTGQRLEDSGEEFALLSGDGYYGIVGRLSRFYLLLRENHPSRSGRVLCYTDGGVLLEQESFNIPLSHTNPVGLMYSALNQVWYVGQTGSRTIYAYSAEDGRPVPTMNASLGRGNDDIRGMTQAGTRLYILDGADRYLYAYNLSWAQNFNNDQRVRADTGSPTAVASNSLQLLVLDGRSTVWVYGQDIPETGVLPSIRGLPFLKRVPLQLPFGYTLSPGGMTADTDRVYFAVTENEEGASRMLVYNQQGQRIVEEEFFIPRWPIFPEVFGVFKRGDIFYLVTREQGTTRGQPPRQYAGRVRQITAGGLEGQGFEIVVDSTRPAEWHGSPIGIAFVNNGWWILGYEARTDGAGVTAAWRYDRMGDEEILQKVRLSPQNRHLAGLAVTERRLRVLDTNDRLIYDYSYGFAEFVGDATSLVSQNSKPRAIGWNGFAAIVFDEDNGLFFYGDEAPTTRAPDEPDVPEEQPDVPVFLYRLPAVLPDGYVVVRGGITADETRVYIAATNAGVASRMFVFSASTGERIMDEEFDIPLFQGFPFIYGVTLVDDNFYIVTREAGFVRTEAETDPEATLEEQEAGEREGVFRYYSGRVRVFSREGIEGVGFRIWSTSSEIQTGQQNPTGIVFSERGWWVGGSGSIGRQVAAQEGLYRFNLNGVALPEDTRRIDNVVRINAGFTRTADSLYILDSAELLLHRYSNQVTFAGHRHDVELHSANLFPLGIGWADNKLVVYDRTGELFFYGNIINAILPRPEQGVDAVPGPVIATGVSRRHAPSRQQFRFMEDFAVAYDIIKLVGATTIFVRGLNVPCLVQSTAERLDLTTSITVTQQLDTLTVFPKWTIPNVEVGDLIVPATGATTPAEITQVPRRGRLRVVGVYTIGDDQYQEIYATEEE